MLQELIFHFTPTVSSAVIVRKRLLAIFDRGVVAFGVKNAARQQTQRNPIRHWMCTKKQESKKRSLLIRRMNRLLHLVRNSVQSAAQKATAESSVLLVATNFEFTFPQLCSTKFTRKTIVRCKISFQNHFKYSNTISKISEGRKCVLCTM